MSDLGVAGFFGKLPSRGDFVSRRLSRRFVDVWDGWLQKALASSRAQLGAEWLEVYLTSPAWSFALSTEICGETGYVGVMIPSVDRVGRYFPLVAAVPHADMDSTLRAAHELQAWYARTQELLLEALDDPPLELDAFDARLEGIGPSMRTVEPIADSDWPGSPGVNGEPALWQFSVPSPGELASCRSAVMAHAAGQALGAHGVWWTLGSERVEASVLVTTGLPEPGAFAAMLGGRWSEFGWKSAQLRVDGIAERRPRTRTAVVSDAGKVRLVNEDAYACRDSTGVWLVADGLGGHEAGDVASRMVVSVAAQVSPLDGLEARLARLVDGLNVVNGCLQVLADHDASNAIMASTVCGLVLGESVAACLWVGDSRIYRLRDGRIEQLTQDHVGAKTGEAPVNDGTVDGSAADTGSDQRDHAITRAVGGSATLELDVCYEDLCPGDCYLLCTDGVYGEIETGQLADALSVDDPQSACDELKKLILAGDAPDNLTAVVVRIEGMDGAGLLERESRLRE